MRTRLKGTPEIFKPGSGLTHQEFAFVSPVNLIVTVNDGKPLCASVNVVGEADGFAEVILELPGDAITGPLPLITIGGDHISSAFWFYQWPILPGKSDADL